MNQSKPKRAKDVCKVTLMNGRYVIIEELHHYKLTDDGKFYLFVDNHDKCVFYANAKMVESVQLLYDGYGQEIKNCHVHERDVCWTNDEVDLEYLKRVLGISEYRHG
jgi:hypothetical protein